MYVFWQLEVGGTYPKRLPLMPIDESKKLQWINNIDINIWFGDFDESLKESSVLDSWHGVVA